MKKLQNIIDILKDNQAALIYNPISRRYLTCFESSLGYLFLSKKGGVILVDGRYIEAAQREVSGKIKVELLTDLSAQSKELLKFWSIDEILCETSNTFADINRFNNIFSMQITPSQQLEDLLLNLRAVKEENEVENIETAQRMAEKAFDEVLGFIRPGVTEIQIVAELEYRMKLAGSEEVSFSTIAISGEKTSMPHGVPGDRIVKNGDFITMDFGAVYKGYHSDMTRTIAMGFATDEMQKVYDTVLKANLSALERVKEGVSAKEVDYAARDIIKAAGYEKQFTHSTGHGVGLEIHEEPIVSPKNSGVLRQGLIITIEPGIYLPGKFGVRIEDMVFVTKNGCNNLTKTQKTLIII